MKGKIQFLLAAGMLLLAVAACRNEEEAGAIDALDRDVADQEAVMESVFDEVDEIDYYGQLYASSSARVEESESSPIFCAQRNHDLANKTITIDFGDGCIGPRGRERKGRIIITYTGRLLEPGAVHTVTFEDFYINDIRIEGTRTKQNLSESTGDYLRFRLTLENGKITFPDGSVITREAEWIVTRIRAFNPLNDVIIREGGCSGVTKNGLEYSVEITVPVVWIRGCLPPARIFLPVEGIKVITVTGGPVITIDYGDGECDNLMTITKDGVSEVVEFRRFKNKD
jgi:hypothetical protein